MEAKTYSVIGCFIVSDFETKAIDVSKIITVEIEEKERKARETEQLNPARGLQLDPEFSSWFVSLKYGPKNEDRFAISEHETASKARVALRNFLHEIAT